MSEEPSLSIALKGVLERFSSPEPLPAGGSATALVACLAASLVVKVAVRRGDAGIVGRARDLAGRAADLADEDVVAYADVLDALDVPRDDPVRADRLATALAAAAVPPLEVTEIAAEVAALAARVGADAHASLRADAAAAATLAASAASAASGLVAANLPSGDDRRRRAASAAEQADEVATALVGRSG